MFNIVALFSFGVVEDYWGKFANGEGVLNLFFFCVPSASDCCLYIYEIYIYVIRLCVRIHSVRK